MAGHTRKTPIDPLVGMWIELGRLRKELTQKQLGDLVGTTGACISHYENGRSNPPRDRMMILASELGLPDEVVTGKGATAEDRAFFALCLQVAREGGPELLTVVESLLPALLRAQRSGALPELAARILKSLS